MARRAILKAADADREHVAERLRQATAEGRLLAHELEERLETAFSARTYGELEALISDLPREVARPRRRRELPVPWPAAVLGLLIVGPVIVALAVAAIVLVVSMLAVWAVFAMIAMWLFGHRLRFFAPRVHRRAWHTGAHR